MNEATYADTSPFDQLTTTGHDTRRLGLVLATGVVALAVIALAWAVTPATGAAEATGALAVGAASIGTLSMLGLAAAHLRAREQIAVQADAIGTLQAGVDEALAGSGPETQAVGEQVAELEARLEKVETVQTEQIIEWIESTKAPQGSADVPAGGPEVTTQG